MSDEILMVWFEESVVEGLLFLMCSIKVSIKCSSILGWVGGVGGIGVSYVKAGASGITILKDTWMEWIISEGGFYGWFGWGWGS